MKKKENKIESDSISAVEAIPNSEPSLLKKIRMFIKSEKFRKSLGLSLMATVAFLLVAFFSYFMTWNVDFDKVTKGFTYMSENANRAHNLAGNLGAYVSHHLIRNGLGIGSLSILLILFSISFSLLFDKKLFNFRKLFVNSVFISCYLSFVLAVIFRDSYFNLGGKVGFEVTGYLNNILGKTGTIIMAFLFSSIVFLRYFYGTFSNINFKKSFSKSEEVLEELNNENDSITSEQQEEPVIQSFVSKFENREVIDSELKKIRSKKSEPSVIEEPVFTINNRTEEKNEEVSFEINKQEIAEINEEAESPETFEVSNEESSHSFPEYETQKIVAVENITEELTDYDPKLDLSTYKHPDVSLLDVRGSDKLQINEAELNANKDRITDTLRNYSIEISKVIATVGPTVTLYEIVPAPGVRISKIKNLEDDIALSLSALGIRIIAPIPGKGTIGIEVPNQKPEMVSMRSIIASEKFQNSEFDLPIALGKTINNEIFITDLAKMPHLLMAGATGQGKSVGLNAILVSLLFKKHPSQIKFVLVDPKKVELTLFNIIEKHFLAKLPDSSEPIITDTKKVIHTLNSLCIEMDSRYELLKDAQVRNLKEYNAKFISRKLNPLHGHRYLPYIVLVVDEFADLIMTAGKEVEMPIARLAQLARAIGIHLIIATQRPSVNIITGTIKANFPARIAFRVSSKIDSRTILDANGAEQLIGRGDMLLSLGSDLIRIQCAFVDTPEVERIAEHIGKQQSYPHAYELPEFVGDDEDKKEDLDLSETDPFFIEAARIVVQTQQGSTSLIQRRLKLGYNRAGRIMDQLESIGIVGPNEGSKARQVLIPTLQGLDDFLKEKSLI